MLVVKGRWASLFPQGLSVTSCPAFPQSDSCHVFSSNCHINLLDQMAFVHAWHLKGTLKFSDTLSLDEVSLRNSCYQALTSHVNDSDIFLWWVLEGYLSSASCCSQSTAMALTEKACRRKEVRKEVIQTFLPRWSSHSFICSNSFYDAWLPGWSYGSEIILVMNMILMH